MKTIPEREWTPGCVPRSAAGKSAKRANTSKKKLVPVHTGTPISPDSHNMRGEGRVSGSLRQTPAP